MCRGRNIKKAGCRVKDVEEGGIQRGQDVEKVRRREGRCKEEHYVGSKRL